MSHRRKQRDLFGEPVEGHQKRRFGKEVEEPQRPHGEAPQVHCRWRVFVWQDSPSSESNVRFVSRRVSCDNFSRLLATKHLP